MSKVKNYNMSCVKSKDSDIELILRKALWARGHRYRKNYSKLPGKPDIVFVSKKLAIFCDGDFWHGFDWENNKRKFKSNKRYWINKIENNMLRDAKINKELLNLGWKVLRFWGSKIQKDTDECVEEIEKNLRRKN